MIVGYDEHPDNVKQTGSDNVVIGEKQTFTSWGDLLAGSENTVSAPHSVAFGLRNQALADWSSVTGGRRGSAEGRLASITGGAGNTALGQETSISGGGNNRAVADSSSILGGRNIVITNNFETSP